MPRPFPLARSVLQQLRQTRGTRHASLSGAMRLVLHELGLLNDRSKSLYLAHCLIHLQVNKPIHFHGISIGSSLTIGSMKPLTIMPAASDSPRPRLMR